MQKCFSQKYVFIPHGVHISFSEKFKETIAYYIFIIFFDVFEKNVNKAKHYN